MNAKAVKKLRRILKANEFQKADEFRASVRTLPLISRLKLAWKIVWRTDLPHLVVPA